MARGCEDCKRFHRRAQKAEAEVLKLTAQLANQHTTWDSPERVIEARERDQMMETLGRFWAGGCRR